MYRSIRSCVREAPREAAARCADPRRADPGAGAAVLPDLLALPRADGVGADPGGHAVSPAPGAGRPHGRAARLGGDADHPARGRADRRAHRAAAEFGGRLGASPGRRRAAGHAADSPAPAGRGRMAGGRGKVYASWQLAHDNLPALVKSLQPKIGELAKAALAMVASIGGGILAFVAAFIIAGIIMAFGAAGDRAAGPSSRASPATNAATSSPCCRWRRSAPSPRA